MIRLAGIAGDSIVDGPGIRTTIFAQGCPHHCPGCHNPETWSFEGGQEWEEEAILDVVRANPLCGGVTFSGGEPFAQSEGFCRLAELLRGEGYEVAAYTGYTFEELMRAQRPQRRLLGALDVLVDGPFLLEERSLELSFRGSRNQRILDVAKSLRAGAPVEASPRWQGEYLV